MDALEATIRGQEQELNQMRLQRDRLKEKLQQNEESAAKWLESLRNMRHRFSSALSVLQVCCHNFVQRWCTQT